MNIKELAEQCWEGESPKNFNISKFAELVAALEREECAKVCDRFQARDVGMQPAECAGAIRQRGKA